MAKKKGFNVGTFVSENPFISLILLGGISYGGYKVYKSIKDKARENIDESETNPFNWKEYIDSATAYLTKKGLIDSVISIKPAEALERAKKLHKTWNSVGFDYPEEALSIVRSMESKYDLAKVLKSYFDNYGFDYRDKIKDKYSEEEYNKVIDEGNDLKKWRLLK